MIPIHLDGVSKAYDDNPPVITIDLKVDAGTFFTLLGPSGCGKSTLLRMVAGFIAPTVGRIRFGERDVTGLPPHKRGIGMVFQNYALFPHMSVADNVAYGLKLRGIRKSDRGANVARALDQVGLTGYGERRIDQLSGGQQQRVALARALVIGPELLLLDEPLSNLDAKLREETRMQIRRAQKEAETTALYVTHDQAEAMSMSDRIAVLADGRAHQVGTPREIYRRPATPFVARFIGRSNVVPVSIQGVEAGRARVSFANATFTVERDPDLPVERGQELQASLRPEALRLAGETDGRLAGIVKTVEFLGSQAMVDVDVAGTNVTVATTELDLLEGDRVNLAVDEKAAWLIPASAGVK